MTGLSYKGRRDKGVRGEREVMSRLEEEGFDVRGLEGRGDHLASKLGVDGLPVLLHVEVKRQETLRIDEWCRQATEEAPFASTAICVYRRNEQPWRVVISLDDFLRLIK